MDLSSLAVAKGFATLPLLLYFPSNYSITRLESVLVRGSLNFSKGKPWILFQVLLIPLQGREEINTYLSLKPCYHSFVFQ